jgi:hypothetical protein
MKRKCPHLSRVLNVVPLLEMLGEVLTFVEALGAEAALKYLDVVRLQHVLVQLTLADRQNTVSNADIGIVIQ